VARYGRKAAINDHRPRVIKQRLHDVFKGNGREFAFLDVQVSAREDGALPA
jgi:hypothetical protein